MGIAGGITGGETEPRVRDANALRMPRERGHRVAVRQRLSDEPFSSGAGSAEDEEVHAARDEKVTDCSLGRYADPLY
jgi:hypothetical protein